MRWTPIVLMTALAGAPAGAQQYREYESWENEMEVHRPQQGVEYEYEWDERTGRWVLKDVEREQYEWEPGEGYHEQEWYDPSDWFNTGRDVEYERDDWGRRVTQRQWTQSDDDEGWEWESVEGEWEYEAGDFEYEYDPYEGVFRVQRDRDWWWDEDVAEYRWRPGQPNAPEAIRSGRIPPPPGAAPRDMVSGWRQFEWAQPRDRGSDRDEQRGWEWQSLKGEWEYETDGYEYEYDPDSGRLQVERQRWWWADEDIAEYQWRPGQQDAPPAIRSGRIPPPPTARPGEGGMRQGAQPMRHDTAERWSPQRERTQAYQTQQRGGEDQLRARVLGFDRSREGASGPEVVRLHLRTDDGREHTLPLGEEAIVRRQLSSLREGDPIMIRGERQQVQGRSMFRPTELRTQEGTFAIPAYARGQKLSGEVLGVRTMQVREGRGEGVIARVRTRGGQEMEILLGERDSVRGLGRLRQGSQIEISGYVREVNGSRTFVVEDVNVQGSQGRQGSQDGWGLEPQRGQGERDMERWFQEGRQQQQQRRDDDLQRWMQQGERSGRNGSGRTAER